MGTCTPDGAGMAYLTVEKFKIRRSFKNGEMQGSEKNPGRAVY